MIKVHNTYSQAQKLSKYNTHKPLYCFKSPFFGRIANKLKRKDNLLGLISELSEFAVHFETPVGFKNITDVDLKSIKSG